VVAGRWYVDWKQSRAYDQQLKAMRHGRGSLLKPGDPFPDVEVVGLNGSPSGTLKIVEDQTTLLLLVSVGCEPCTEMINTWKQDLNDLPSDVQVIGICQGDPEYAEVYMKKTGFPFLLYCDTGYVFPSKYGLDVFPSMVGLTADGLIAFLFEGRHATISLLDGSDLIPRAD
jgi:peroxiredoxin